MPFSCPPHVLHGGTSEISSGRYPLYFIHQQPIWHRQWLLQRKADCPLPPTEEQDYPLPGAGRGRSESPEGSASSLVPARQTQVGQSTALSSSHPPSPNPLSFPWERTRFWTGLTRQNPRLRTCCRMCPPASPLPLINSASHGAGKTWSTTGCLFTPKKNEECPEDTVWQTIIRNFLAEHPRHWEKCCAWNFGGRLPFSFLKGKGGEEFSYVVLLPLLLKSISLTGELVLQTGDFLLFPCNSELAKKKRIKQVRRHFRHFKWSSAVLSRMLTCLLF